MSHKVAIVDNVGIKAGMDKYSDALAKGLVCKGKEVWMLSNFIGNTRNVSYEVLFNAKREGLLSDLKNWISPWRKAHKICQEAGIDHAIIHLFSFGLKDFMALRILRVAGLKIHAIVHDPEHLGKGEGPIDFKDRILAACHHIYVHNQVSAAFLPKTYQDSCGILPHGNFHDIPTGLSKSEARSRLGWNDDLPRVLFFGQIKPSKGLDVLISSMANLKRQAHLVIAGRPWQEDVSIYTDLIQSSELEVEAHLRFISNEERDLFFKASDLIVMPYRKIFQSGVLQMAFSYELPVICSDLPAFQELDPGQELMKRFKPGDSASLTEVIKEALQDGPVMLATAQRAYHYAAIECSWEAIADRFIFDDT